MAFEDDHQYIHNIHIIEIIENYMSKKLEQTHLRVAEKGNSGPKHAVGIGSKKLNQ